MEKVDAIAATLNDLAAKLMVVEMALQELTRSLPADVKTGIAASMRTRAATAMQAHAAGFSPAMDATFSLSLAALLEAAGEPPSRG